MGCSNLFTELDEIYLVQPKTQREAVLKVLKYQGEITSWEAFTDWGITRLAAIIHDLKKEEGLNIEAEDVTSKNRFGHTVTFSKYKLKSNDETKILIDKNVQV